MSMRWNVTGSASYYEGASWTDRPSVPAKADVFVRSGLEWLAVGLDKYERRYSQQNQEHSDEQRKIHDAAKQSQDIS